MGIGWGVCGESGSLNSLNIIEIRVEAACREGFSDFSEVETRSAIDVVSCEPTLIHFQRKLNLIVYRTNTGFSVGIHWVNFLQNSIGGEIANIQRNSGVAHPKTAFFSTWIDKEHTMIRCQRLAKHQSSRRF